MRRRRDFNAKSGKQCSRERLWCVKFKQAASCHNIEKRQVSNAPTTNASNLNEQNKTYYTQLLAVEV